MDQLEAVTIDRARLRSDADLLGRAVLSLLDPKVATLVTNVAGLLGMHLDLAQSISGLASETDELTDDQWHAVLGFVEREASAIRRASPTPAYVLPEEQAALSTLRALIRSRR